MGHDNDAAAVAFKVCLQPGDGFHIQVVGRLIQKQDIRLGEKQLAQGNAGFLPSGKGVDVFGEFLLLKSKAL